MIHKKNKTKKPERVTHLELIAKALKDAGYLVKTFNTECEHDDGYGRFSIEVVREATVSPQES